MKFQSLFLALWLVAPLMLNADDPVVSPQSLPSGVIARVGDFEVPYDWFLNEFRSTFFRYAQSANVRQEVFDPFLEKMTLYQLARSSGVGEDAAFQQELNLKMDGMKAFMDYQLAMARMGLYIQAYLKAEGIDPGKVTVTDEELQAFLAEEGNAFPGALPDSLGELQPHVKDMLSQRLVSLKVAEAVKNLVREKREDLKIEVQQSLIDSVPLPEMKGTPPPGMRGLPAGSLFKSP